jgi:hypothetical protein
MYEISGNGCSFLGRFYLEIEKQGLSGAERRGELQASTRQRAHRGGSGWRPCVYGQQGSRSDGVLHPGKPLRLARALKPDQRVVAHP